jgi:hypothetical protein
MNSSFFPGSVPLSRELLSDADKVSYNQLNRELIEISLCPDQTTVMTSRSKFLFVPQSRPSTFPQNISIDDLSQKVNIYQFREDSSFYSLMFDIHLDGSSA